MAKKDFAGFQKAVEKADKKLGAKTTFDKKGGLMKTKAKGAKGFTTMTKVKGKAGKGHAGRVKAHARAVAKAGAKYGVHGVGSHSGGSAG